MKISRLLKRLIFNTVRYSAMEEAAKSSCKALVREKWKGYIGQLLQINGQANEQKIFHKTIYDEGVNIQIMS